MTFICAKEVLFFGAESRDTSQLLYLLLTVHKHDLIGLKNRRFCPVENDRSDRKGKNGLRVGTGTRAATGAGARTGTLDEKFGTWNRNLGKMARFRNTAIKYIQNMLPILLEYKIHNIFALFKSKPNFHRVPNFNFFLQNLSPYFNTIRNV
jgi:hypothetical protein